jgi:hypothetical protein
MVPTSPSGPTQVPASCRCHAISRSARPTCDLTIILNVVPSGFAPLTREEAFSQIKKAVLDFKQSPVYEANTITGPIASVDVFPTSISYYRRERPMPSCRAARAGLQTVRS